jgi:thiol-disulfide isomerase/thioredoxin
MRYPLLFTLLIISLTNLAAQDSLRLTIKLDGFKDKDELSIAFSEGQFNFPTDKEDITIVRKLNEPELMSFFYKNKYQSFWIDNTDMEVYIPKSGFSGGLVAKGSPSQALWNSILEAPQEKKASILEENIDNKVTHTYLATNSNALLPTDRERLLTMVPEDISDQAKYSLSGLDIDRKTKIKENDMIFDFTAKDADGNEFSTTDYRGEYLLLDFAATGCGWCWIGYPDLIEIKKEYPSLKVITYNEDFSKEGWSKQAERLKLNIDWPVLWEADDKREVFVKYGIDGWPYFFLISPEGEVLEAWFGSRKGRLVSALKKHID